MGRPDARLRERRRRKWVVLTDGNEYRIYNSIADAPVEDKLFRRVLIAGDDPSVVDTLALVSKAQLQENQIDVLWQADFVDRQVKVGLDGLFGPESPTDFVNLVRRHVPSLAPADIRASLARARFTVDFPSVQTAPHPPIVTPPPARVPPAITAPPAPVLVGRAEGTAWDGGQTTPTRPHGGVSRSKT